MRPQNVKTTGSSSAGLAAEAACLSKSGLLILHFQIGKLTRKQTIKIDIPELIAALYPQSGAAGLDEKVATSALQQQPDQSERGNESLDAAYGGRPPRLGQRNVFQLAKYEVPHHAPGAPAVHA